MKTFVSLMAVVLLWVSPALAAQSNKERPENEATSYKLEYTMYELDNGKRTNERQFVVHAGLRSNQAGNVRITMRVPVPAEKGPLYMDVGLTINSSIDATGGADIMLRTNLELSGLVSEGNEPKAGTPLLRNLQLNATTLIVPGKPTLIGSIDDVNTKHRFQIEVTATKAK